ncbi:hypothetical protein IWW50_000524 [Coemansia erecta]|nr:hypothetical protein IWW50_000524 [Coemansia erecta]
MMEANEQTVEELSILEGELESMSAGTSVFQKLGRSPIYILADKSKIEADTRRQLNALKSHSVVQEAAMFATAVGALVAVSSWSTLKYVVCGPAIGSWTHRTQLSRDLIRFLVFSTSSPLMRAIGRASHQYWPVLAQYADPLHADELVTELEIPGYPLDPRVLDNAGIWAPQLAETARLSRDMRMYGECVYPAGTYNRSTASTDAVVLYMHGGAYTSGSAWQYRSVHLRLARATRLRVFGFSYRLAPEHQYPVALYDAYAAYTHLLTAGHQPQNIIFAGDSAGGNLALALWQLTRAPLRALVLLSPRVDVTSTRDSWAKFAHVDVIGAYSVRDPMAPVYQLLGSASKTVLEDPFVAPVHGRLAGMPRTLVQLGACEVMRDDIREFVQRARGLGNHLIEVQEYEGMFHVFQAALSGTQHVGEAWDAVGAFIKRCVALTIQNE